MLVVNTKISRTRARQKVVAWLWEIAPEPTILCKYATVVVCSSVDSKIFSFELFYSEVAKKWLTMN
jgi:hypothetical protein